MFNIQKIIELIIRGVVTKEIMDDEYIDALVHWLSGFDKSDPSVDITENPDSLFDGIYLSKVYNQLVEDSDKINIDNLKKPKDENDWVSMLMNFRQINGKISPALKKIRAEVNFNVNDLVRKKDHSELLKFLKYFLLFSVKAPNRKISIQQIRGLESNYKSIMQSILEEVTPKKEEQQQPQETQNSSANSQSTQQNEQLDAISQAKIRALDNEIAELLEKKKKLDKEIEEQEQKNKNLEPDSSGKMAELLNDAKRRHQQAKDKRDKLKKKLEDAEESLNTSRNQLDDLRQQQQRFMGSSTTSADSQKTNAELKVRWARIQEEILEELKKDPKTAAEIERNPPQEADDYIKLLGLQELINQVENLKQENDAIQKNTQMKEAELQALTKTLDEQNKVSSLTLRRRIAQLNSEIDASPIGDAKRLSIKYQRVIKKLENDIQSLKAGCSDMEVQELQKQLQLMAERKAREGNLLAKKQSLVQATAEQCDIRLERLKLNVALQTHSSRVSKWKNCFVIPQK